MGGGKDLDGGVTGAPVEGVGGAEDGDLWGMNSSSQVNGGGIATQADSGLGEECGEGGEIELAGEGDDGVWGMGDDFSEVGVGARGVRDTVPVAEAATESEYSGLSVGSGVSEGSAVAEGAREGDLIVE